MKQKGQSKPKGFMFDLMNLEEIIFGQNFPMVWLWIFYESERKDPKVGFYSTGKSRYGKEDKSCINPSKSHSPIFKFSPCP